jgi:hypothetical protein
MSTTTVNDGIDVDTDVCVDVDMDCDIVVVVDIPRFRKSSWGAWRFTER